MKTRRDFLKRTALLGASAFIAPSLLGRESDGDCFFSQESTSSMLVPMGDALKITGTFLDEISHDIPTKDIKVTDKFAIPIFAQAIWNPRMEDAHLVFGITLKP